jgi:hypothetical protein
MTENNNLLLISVSIEAVVVSVYFLGIIAYSWFNKPKSDILNKDEGTLEELVEY